MVDPELSARAVIGALLVRLGHVVVDVPDAPGALAAAAAGPLAGVVIEVRLDGASGYQLAPELRARAGAALAVVFVSAHPEDEVPALMVGGDDFILKPVQEDRFLARVRRLTERVPSARAPDTGLTPREHEVLTLLAAGRRPAEIARKLCISSKTTSTHVERILSKLGAHSQAQAVAFALNDGIVTPDPFESALSRR